MFYVADPDVVSGEWLKPEPTPNLPLLRKVLAQIDAEPDAWEQRAWGVQWLTDAGREHASQGDRDLRAISCGTAYCIGGHVALLEGWQPMHWDGYGEASMVWQNAEGQRRGVDWIARTALGLTRAEAEVLFAAYNTREDVQFHAEQIAARAGERL